MIMTQCCGRGVCQDGPNRWRAKRHLRGKLHRKSFTTRTEAALFYDLIGGDGVNFPGDSNDASQMAETLRDVRSCPLLHSGQACECHGQRNAHTATSTPVSMTR